MVLLKSLFSLALGMVVGRAAATTTTPICVSSGEGYVTGQVNYLYNNFCQQLENNKFASDIAVYGMPLISFSFAASGTGTCNQNNCLASFKSIVSSCGLANNTIWGTGSLDAGCGTYNFTIINTEAAALGQATTTLLGATMTTAATINTAISSTSSSTSSEPTLISNSVISTSAPSTNSSSIEPSNISSSISMPTAVYANSTSASIASTGAVITSPASLVGASSTVAQKSTNTKPVVGSTALGNAGDMVRVSGLGLVGIACAFAAFL